MIRKILEELLYRMDLAILVEEEEVEGSFVRWVLMRGGSRDPWGPEDILQQIKNKKI
jgi:hypothetical protein